MKILLLALLSGLLVDAACLVVILRRKQWA
jgi:hypothetical protein